MHFEMNEAIQILERTPRMLDALLSGLSEQWLAVNEGANTWNVVQVLDHLIESEKSNWIPRLEKMVQSEQPAPLSPFDRYAHLHRRTRSSIDDKCTEFQALRTESMTKLKKRVHGEAQLEATGIHPDFGLVNVRQLLSTWVVHDLTHTAQILRVMAKRYKQDVGPWVQYLSILNPKVN